MCGGAGADEVERAVAQAGDIALAAERALDDVARDRLPRRMRLDRRVRVGEACEGRLERDRRDTDAVGAKRAVEPRAGDGHGQCSSFAGGSTTLSRSLLP